MRSEDLNSFQKNVRNLVAEPEHPVLGRKVIAVVDCLGGVGKSHPQHRENPHFVSHGHPCWFVLRQESCSSFRLSDVGGGQERPRQAPPPQLPRVSGHLLRLQHDQQPQRAHCLGGRPRRARACRHSRRSAPVQREGNGHGDHRDVQRDMACPSPPPICHATTRLPHPPGHDHNCGHWRARGGARDGRGIAGGEEEEEDTQWLRTRLCLREGAGYAPIDVCPHGRASGVGSEGVRVLWAHLAGAVLF